MENFSEIVSQNAPEMFMQQGNGSGGAATNNIAAQRKLANNARGFDAVDKGKENTGRNSGFAVFSRTAGQVTTQAGKNKVIGAKSAATRANNKFNKNLDAETAVKSVDADQRLRDATAKPVSAASSRYVTAAPKKPKAVKAAAKKRPKSIGAVDYRKKAKV